MYNKAFMVGKVVTGPQFKQLDNGTKLCFFRLKTDDPHAQYHNINCYDKTAEKLEHLIENDIIFVEGRVITRKYKDKSGQDKYSTSINAARVAKIDDYRTNATDVKKAEVDDEDVF